MVLIDYFPALVCGVLYKMEAASQRLHSWRCLSMNDIRSGTMLSRSVWKLSPSGVPLCDTAISSMLTRFAIPF